MATTRYCRIHGEYNVYGSSLGGCPDCQRIEQENAATLEDIARGNVSLAAQVVYHSTNPGDYECPACRMVSLKYYASRCPLCQKDIDNSYWQRIDEKKRLAREKEKQEEEDRQKWLASPEFAKEQEDKKRTAAAEARTKRASELAQGARTFAFVLGLVGALNGCCWGTIGFLDHFERQAVTGIGDLFVAILGGLIVGGGVGFCIVAGICYVMASLVNLMRR